jgi:hypothetical protein
MVMQVFIRKNIGWLFAAIGYHALIDAAAVFGQPYLTAYELEAAVGGFAVVSMVIIFLLFRPERQPDLVPVPMPMAEFSIKAPEETDDNLEKTRYQ